MKAVIYARVSSGLQADLGTSIPSQIKICEEYAKKNNLEIVKIYQDEGKSARTDERPGFIEMINDAKKSPPPFDVILIYNQSRFSRNLLDVLTYKNLLKKYGISVISVTEPFDEDSPQGKLINGIISVINEFYSINLAHETIRGQKENALQGYWNGGVPPIGYKVKKVKRGNALKSTFEIDEEYAPIVKKIYNLFLQGNGIKKIAIILNQLGIKTPRGNLWKPSTIRNILTNKVYTGTLIWNKYDKKTENKKYKDKEQWIVVKNVIPKIIDENVFNYVQKIIDQNRKFNPKSIARTHILSGILKCGYCGANYVYCKVIKRSENKIYQTGYYRCSTRNNIGKDACDNISIKSDLIEKTILNLLKEKIFTTDNISKILNELNQNMNSNKQLLDKEKSLIEKNIKNINLKINNLLKSLEKGAIEELIIKRINELKKEKDELENKLKTLNQTKIFEYKEEDFKNLIEIIQDKLKNSNDKVLNNFLKIFIEKILVYKDNIEIYYTFPLDGIINRNGENINLNDLGGDLDINLSAFNMVPRDGIEPPTRGFSVLCSTN